MRPFEATVGDWVVTDGSDGQEQAVLVVGIDWRGWLRLNSERGWRGWRDPAGYRLAMARERAVFRDNLRAVIDRQRESKGEQPVNWE